MLSVVYRIGLRYHDKDSVSCAHEQDAGFSEYTFAHRPSINGRSACEEREQTMGETPHSIVLQSLLMGLGIRAKAWRIRVLPLHHLQLADGSTRLCDICVADLDHAGEDLTHRPPLLCVEVLSPQDGMSDMYELVDKYIETGVKQVWVIDPRRRALYQSDGQSPHPVQHLEVPGTDVLIYPSEVFNELNDYEAHPQ